MIREYNLEELRALSGLLAAGLWNAPTEESDSLMPWEVYKTLEEARAQMNDLPRIIGELVEALDNFQALKLTLGRMKALTEAALELPPEAAGPGCLVLDREFVELAEQLALKAGRAIYDGPKLRLVNQAQAHSARLILGYLEPVLKATAQQLDEQKELIIAAFNETINFLEIVAHSYPEDPGVKRLPGLLRQVRDSSGHQVPLLSNSGIMFH